MTPVSLCSADSNCDFLASLKADHDVCVICGSLNECPHDGSADENDDSSSSETPSGDMERFSSSKHHEPTFADDTCEMVSNAPIFADDEVFNTYGENLTNAELLMQYGFVLDGNENDCIRWDWDQLFSAATLDDMLQVGTASSFRSSSLADSANLRQLFYQAVGLWHNVEKMGLVETSLIFNPRTATVGTRPSPQGSGGLPERYERQGALNSPLVFCVNSDGKISRDLWLYCALLGYVQYNGDAADLHPEAFVGVLRETSKLLWRLETEEGSDVLLVGWAADNDCGAHRRFAEYEWGSRQVITKPSTPLSYTIRTIVCLCYSRRARIGKRDLLGASDVGDELDVSRDHALFSSLVALLDSSL